jgi:hypothetical protein
MTITIKMDIMMMMMMMMMTTTMTIKMDIMIMFQPSPREGDDGNRRLLWCQWIHGYVHWTQ